MAKKKKKGNQTGKRAGMLFRFFGGIFRFVGKHWLKLLIAIVILYGLWPTLQRWFRGHGAGLTPKTVPYLHRMFTGFFPFERGAAFELIRDLKAPDLLATMRIYQATYGVTLYYDASTASYFDWFGYNAKEAALEWMRQNGAP